MLVGWLADVLLVNRRKPCDFTEGALAGGPPSLNCSRRTDRILELPMFFLWYMGKMRMSSWSGLGPCSLGGEVDVRRVFDSSMVD